MDYIQLIGTLGFPIVVCICMALYVREQNKNQREDIRAMNEQYSKQLSEVTTAVNNNTIAITKLCDRIEIVSHILEVFMNG